MPGESRASIPGATYDSRSHGNGIHLSGGVGHNVSQEEWRAPDVNAGERTSAEPGQKQSPELERYSLEIARLGLSFTRLEAVLIDLAKRIEMLCEQNAQLIQALTEEEHEPESQYLGSKRR